MIDVKGYAKAQWEYDNMEPPEYEDYDDEMEECLMCGRKCLQPICKHCTDVAIFNNKIRIEYINSNSKITKEFLEFNYWDGETLPVENDFEAFEKITGISKDLLKNIPEDDIYVMVNNLAFINCDRGHFVDWLEERVK